MVYKGPMITDKSSRAVSWWVGLNILLWTAAWILAESIPVFNELLGVVSALLGSWFTCKFGFHLEKLRIKKHLVITGHFHRWYERRPLALPEQRELFWNMATNPSLLGEPRYDTRWRDTCTFQSASLQRPKGTFLTCTSSAVLALTHRFTQL